MRAMNGKKKIAGPVPATLLLGTLLENAFHIYAQYYFLDGKNALLNNPVF